MIDPRRVWPVSGRIRSRHVGAYAVRGPSIPINPGWLGPARSGRSPRCALVAVGQPTRLNCLRALSSRRPQPPKSLTTHACDASKRSHQDAPHAACVKWWRTVFMRMENKLHRSEPAASFHFPGLIGQSWHVGGGHLVGAGYASPATPRQRRGEEPRGDPAPLRSASLHHARLRQHNPILICVRVQPPTPPTGRRS